MSETKPPQKRDSEAMRRRILDAATTILSRDGYAGFGLNAVAREAGCDKVLVYRYFGGPDELLAAVGSNLQTWIAPPDLPQGLGYGAFAETMVLDYFRQLRGQALVKAILAWELVEHSERTILLGAAKSEAIRDWFGGLRAKAGPAPEGVDAPAINAILLAAVHHLALREASGTFLGMDLGKAENWDRLEAALQTLLRAVYGEDTPGRN